MNKTQIMQAIENISTMLEENLPETDPKHRDEILDIAYLLSQRTEMYIDNYGLNSDD